MIPVPVRGNFGYKQVRNINPMAEDFWNKTKAPGHFIFLESIECMEIIELECSAETLDNPHKLEYAGQRTGWEVFTELKQRLESLGLLPDEYFLIGKNWEHGEKIPKGADMFVTTDYGGNEGVYVDIYQHAKRSGHRESAWSSSSGTTPAGNGGVTTLLSTT